MNLIYAGKKIIENYIYVVIHSRMMIFIQLYLKPENFMNNNRILYTVKI